MKSTTMKELLAQIERVWPFDSRNYPNMPEGRDEGLAFALLHVMTHASVSKGRMLELLEPTQHGEAISIAGEMILKREAIQLLFQNFRMMALLNVSFLELVDYVNDKEEKMKVS